MWRQQRINDCFGSGGELRTDASIDIASKLDIGAELLDCLRGLGTGLESRDEHDQPGTGQQPSAHGEHW